MLIDFGGVFPSSGPSFGIGESSLNSSLVILEEVKRQKVGTEQEKVATPFLPWLPNRHSQHLSLNASVF
jgi:hypothetical protein